MAVTTGPRTGVTLWDAVDGSDPVSRAQFQASHLALEARAAVDYQQTLPLPAAGTRGRYLWVTDDRGGRLYRDDGANLFDLGPKPIDGPAAGYTARITAHPSAALGDDVLQVRGKTGQTGNLFRLTDPTGATDLVKVTAAGVLDASQSITTDQHVDRQGGLHSIDLRTGGALLTTGAGATAGWTVSSVPTGVVPWRVNGPTGLTADLAQWQIAGANKANLTASGNLWAAGTITAGAGLTVSAGGATITGPSTNVLGSSPTVTTLYINAAAGQSSHIIDVDVAGVRKFQVDAAGQTTINGGILLTGSPSGYAGAGEIQGPGSGGLALSTAAGASPGMYFDHRGAGNTGTWTWRNGTTAGSTRMGLDAAGNLNVYGNLTVGPGGALVVSLTLSGGGASGRVFYQDASLLYVGAIDAARPLVVRSAGTDALTLDNRTSQTLALLQGVTGIGALINATVAGVQKFYVGATGNVQAAGADHFIGSYGFNAGSGSRLHLTDAAGSVSLLAEGASANVNLILRPKGGSLGTSSAYIDMQDVAGGGVARFVQSNASGGSTGFQVWYYVAGTGMVLGTLNVAGAGTGPGGVGRGVYIS